MKHARSDYDRIQDPAGLIPEDEPVFLVRAQDVNSYWMCIFYANMVEDKNPELAQRVRNWAEVMRQWPTKKDPDLPEGV